MEDGGEHKHGLPDGQQAVWDPDAGEVTLWNRDGEEIEMNPYVFEQLRDWVREKNVERHELYFRSTNKDHLVLDGSTLCDYNVRVPENEDSDKLKPLPETTQRAWRIIQETRSMCSECRESGYSAGLIPSVPEGLPSFPCPECGETAANVRVNAHFGIGIADHDDGTTHEFDFEIHQRWRRGENPHTPKTWGSQPAFWMFR
jgi:hypothetical protein